MKRDKNCAQYVQNFWNIQEFDVLAVVLNYVVHLEEIGLEKKFMKKESVFGINF